MSVVVADHRFGALDVERAILGDVVDAGGLGHAEALALCARAEAVLVGARLPLDAAAIGTLERCRAIVRYGVGVDNVDVDAAADAGIWVAYVPDYCIDEVAEHAIALLFALNRQLLALDAAVRADRWGIPAGLEVHRLSTRTLGVIGFGRIGEAVGRRAAALGLTVLAYDPVRPPEQIEAAGARACTLDELLAEADYVSLHAPRLGDAAILSAERIAAMKPGACVINLARGGLIDEPALIAALTEGHLGGAALDVAQAEPLRVGDPLLDAPNVLLTPHAAWYSAESVTELRTKAAHEVARVLAGEPPLHPARALP